MGGEHSPADRIAEALSAYLGPNTARTAVKTFSSRALGLRPEELSREHVPALLDALRPMLRTLLGESRADAVLAELRAAVR